MPLTPIVAAALTMFSMYDRINASANMSITFSLKRNTSTAPSRSLYDISTALFDPLKRANA